MAKKKVFQISNALTEGLEETVSAAQNYNGQLRVEVLPLKKIEMDPTNPRDLILTFEDLLNGIDKQDKDYLRKTKERESLNTLANSIQEQGIINPIVVYKHGDKYRLIAGERRTLSSLVAGKTDIQAKILDTKPSELKISLLQWMENVERKDLSLDERIHNLEQIISAYGKVGQIESKHVNATELSRLLGCSLPHAMNYKAVLSANQNVKTLIASQKIRNLEKAALIASIKSAEIQAEAITACLAGAPLKKLKAIANQEKIKTFTSKIKVKSPGRQAALVQLGATRNLEVAQLIIDAVLNHNKANHLRPHFDNIDWNDYKAMSQAFKRLINNLEALEA